MTTKVNIDKLAKDLASGCRSKDDCFAKDGLLSSLISKTLQACLDAEMTDHLGYEKHEQPVQPNSRNGYSRLTSY